MLSLLLIHSNFFFVLSKVLLQSATAFFITNCDGLLLQSATAFLLQSATGITKCDEYYKVRQYTRLAAIKAIFIHITSLLSLLILT